MPKTTFLQWFSRCLPLFWAAASACLRWSMTFWISRDADWEVGWFVKRSIALRFIGNWQKLHGGLGFTAGVPFTPDEFEIHDRVEKSTHLRLGGGVTFSVNRSFDIHAAYAPTPVYIRNTHGDAGIVMGFSWRFSRGSSDRIATNTSANKLPTVGPGMF